MALYSGVFFYLIWVDTPLALYVRPQITPQIVHINKLIDITKNNINKIRNKIDIATELISNTYTYFIVEAEVFFKCKMSHNNKLKIIVLRICHKNVVSPPIRRSPKAVSGSKPLQNRMFETPKASNFFINNADLLAEVSTSVKRVVQLACNRSIFQQHKAFKTYLQLPKCLGMVLSILAYLKDSMLRKVSWFSFRLLFVFIVS